MSNNLASSLVDIVNNNQGVVTVAIFLLTIFIGWMSGIFRTLRHKPILRIQLIPGPTFICTFETENQFNDKPAHRTCLTLYTNISNIGSAPSSIQRIKVGYKNNMRPYGALSLKQIFGWTWINYEVAALEDFHVIKEDKAKVYPFLTQGNTIIPNNQARLLNPGEMRNGIVYFEQSECWGSFRPNVVDERVRIKLVVSDSFDRKHISKHLIPNVSLDEAIKYNPSFGQTSKKFGESTSDFEYL